MNKLVIVAIISIIIISSGIVIFNLYLEDTKLERVSQQDSETNHIELINAGWSNSGPFYVDMQEYLIGDKIFINTRDLPVEDKGEILIYRPYNNTNSKLYLEIPFDGNSKQVWNYYFTPEQKSYKEICSVNDLLGEWTVVFSGTDYPNLYFEIINQTNAWDKRDYSPVC